MAFKEVSFSVDLDKLDQQLEDQAEQALTDFETSFNARSTVISLGKDPRVSTRKKISAPNLTKIEVLKDGLDNPYIELHWRVPRFDVDAGGIVSFDVYRRRLSKDEIGKEFRGTKRKRNVFSRNSFDMVSKKITRRGKFSEEKKAFTEIDKDLIPAEVLNSNLTELQNSARSRTDYQMHGVKTYTKLASPSPFFGGTDPREISGRIERTVLSRKFEKIGSVNYTRFLAQERKKFVFKTEREFVELSCKDKKVGYGEVFEYYVISIAKDFQQSPRSNVSKVVIENQTPIAPPASLNVFQLSETEVQLRVRADSRDNISNIIIYKRSEDDLSFKRIASVKNINNSAVIVDSTISYGKNNVYRVFVQNIHGVMSEPKEIRFVSTAQRVTPQSRSNSMKIPILTAVQDQNSDYIKITMSSNDASVFYYVLDRRDLTIYERKFSKPSKEGTNYGGDGWESNKFYVNRERQMDSNLAVQRDVFNKFAKESEIIFVDNTVQIGHIYQYRVRGFDLFGNPTPYALSIVKATGKKSIRSPINLNFEILRESPFRVKVVWDDDNLLSKYTADELFEGDPGSKREASKFIYKIQRRRQNETKYVSFPFTVNQFIVDEVAADDALAYEGRFVEEEAVPSRVQNSNVKVSEDRTRPFEMPEFLKENDVYFYRVLAFDEEKNESNYTEEVSVSTLPRISEVVDLKVEVFNAKVVPLVARITWGIEDDKSLPDRWVVERKVDTVRDTFEVIGQAFIDTEFFDRNLTPGNTYVYRMKAIDLLGRESRLVETRLTV
jgi:hypothetical protein